MKWMIVFIFFQGYKGTKGVRGRGGDTGPVVSPSCYNTDNKQHVCWGNDGPYTSHWCFDRKEKVIVKTDFKKITEGTWNWKWSQSRQHVNILMQFEAHLENYYFFFYFSGFFFNFLQTCDLFFWILFPKTLRPKSYFCGKKSEFSCRNYRNLTASSKRHK